MAEHPKTIYADMDSRVRRYHFLHDKNPDGGEFFNSIGKTLPGNYGMAIIHPNGLISINGKAAVEDIVAFEFFCSKNNPEVAEYIKKFLYDYVTEMDKRALARHGYKNSPEAMELNWVHAPPTKASIARDSAPVETIRKQSPAIREIPKPSNLDDVPDYVPCAHSKTVMDFGFKRCAYCNVKV
jgi:hypothetical protein